MTRRAAAGGEAGFALVESIAVLALSGLVLLTLVIAADIISRNSAAAARSANDIETLATGFAAIRRDLEGAQFIRVGSQSEDPVLFSGMPGAVAVAVLNDGTGTNAGGGLVLIQARYEGGRGLLVRSAAPLRPETSGFGGAAFANPAILLSGPWRYRFAYEDPQAGENPWSGEWDAVNRMPTAVRLEVLNNAGRQVLPPLVVRMHIDSAGCADPARVDCPIDDTESPDDVAGQDENGDPQDDGDTEGDGNTEDNGVPNVEQ